MGTIALSQMRGSLTVDLGRFGVSDDSVRVSGPDGGVILIGPFFR